MNLWSSLVGNELNGEKYTLTEDDKQAIADKISEDLLNYELTPEEKAEIAKLVLGELPAGGNEEFELINTVTLTEPSNSIICETDSEGKPFQLKSVVIFIRSKPNPSDAESQGKTYVTSSVYTLGAIKPDQPLIGDYTSQLNPFGLGYYSNQNTYLMGAFSIYAVDDDLEDNGRLMLLHGVPNVYNEKQSGIPEGCNGFCKVGAMCATNYCNFGVGTKFKVYGIRA